MSARPGGGPPNILLVMADQLAAPALRMHGNRVCRTPHLDRLAERAVVFDRAYTPSPLCVPARCSMLTGLLPSRIGVHDNASELPASVPTVAHHLRACGYRTALCGKMHFIGPDQLHGFEERLVTDIYPADFSWIPDWEAGPSFVSSGAGMGSVLEAGPCVRSLQMDYDDDVEFNGSRKLLDLARDPGQRPFFLAVSFTSPHTPFTVPGEFWERHPEAEIDDPAVPPLPFEELDHHSKGLFFAHGRHLHDVGPGQARRARRAYYGMVSQVDDRVGRLLGILDETGLASGTVVVFVSDHGEMLGERGMWHKHHFWEWSARVPLLVRFPGGEGAGRDGRIASLVDLAPTLADIATDGKGIETGLPLDGKSLVRPAGGETGAAGGHAISDYLAIGPCVPCRMVRQGPHKYMHTHGHPPMLFDLDADPLEQRNLAGDPSHSEAERRLRGLALDGWDPGRLAGEVLESQRRRRLVAAAMRGGPNWSHVFREGDDRRYVRDASVDGTKARMRLPPVAPVAPDHRPLSREEVAELMSGAARLDEVRARS